MSLFELIFLHKILLHNIERVFFFSLFQLFVYIHTHIFDYTHTYIWASLVAQTVKNLPAMWQTRVQSTGQEDPLEKEMATHSSILAWRIPWTEEPGWIQSMGLQRVRHD